IAAAIGRVTMSFAPPGGNALMMVIACEGKASCAKAGLAASAAAVPITKLRRSIESSMALCAGLGRRRCPAAEVSGLVRLRALALHAADGVHGVLDALGVRVPERREFRLVEIAKFLAEIGDRGLEHIAVRGLVERAAQVSDDLRRRSLRREHADPQVIFDVVAELLHG